MNNSPTLCVREALVPRTLNSGGIPRALFPPYGVASRFSWKSGIAEPHYVPSSRSCLRGGGYRLILTHRGFFDITTGGRKKLRYN